MESTPQELLVDGLGLPLNSFEPADQARIDLGLQFVLYGPHPHCRGCQADCQQYAAPNSVICYCPKMGTRP